MRRFLSFAVPLIAALALPALAQANTGTVLSVAKKHHQLQVIASNKTVHAFSYSGKLHGVGRGTKLSYTASGSHITRAKATGTANSFSFLGKVVRSNHGALVLSLGDSQQLHLTSKQLGGLHSSKASLHARGSVTLNINGLVAGETIVVTETTDSAGNVTITITIPSGASSGVSAEQTASGLVNNVGTDTFDIITADGSDLNFHMAAAALANVDMDSCDAVVVSYHVDDQMMIADSVVDNGPPDTGACSDGGDGNDSDWVGTITAVSGTSITVDAGADNGGVQTFTVGDPAITTGFLVGDSVDVSYEQDGNQFVADDVEYNDQPTSGVVTAIASIGNGFNTITMIDDYTNQSETFYVSDDVLDGQGVQIGDDVSVDYYQAAQGLTLDDIEDNGPAS